MTTDSCAPPPSLAAAAKTKSSGAAAEELRTAFSGEAMELEDDVAACDWSVEDGLEELEGAASEEVCFIVSLFSFFFCLFLVKSLSYRVHET